MITDRPAPASDPEGVANAEALFMECCGALALHTGSSVDPAWVGAIRALGEVLPDIPTPGPGPRIDTLTLRGAAVGAVNGGLSMDDVRHFMRILLAEHSGEKLRAAYQAWRVDPCGSGGAP